MFYRLENDNHTIESQNVTVWLVRFGLKMWIDFFAIMFLEMISQ